MRGNDRNVAEGRESRTSQENERGMCVRGRDEVGN